MNLNMGVSAIDPRLVVPGVLLDGPEVPEPVEVFAVSRLEGLVRVAGLGVVTGNVYHVELTPIQCASMRLNVPPDDAVLAADRVSPTSLPLPTDGITTSGTVYNPAGTVVVFIHGIFSNSRSCWLAEGPRRRVFWPDLIRVDPRMETPSIYLCGYYTALDSGTFALDQCARQVLEAIERPDVTGRPPVLDKTNIIFVCHSTGGIVARYLLCRYGQVFRSKGIGLALIASPSRGSVWANVAAVAARYYNQALGRQLSWSGEAIEEIHSRFKDLVNARSAELPGLFGMEACETQMIFRRKLPTTIRRLIPNWLRVVSTESAGQYFGQVKYLPDTDHFSVVKPDRLAHPTHEFLETFVRRFRRFQEARHLPLEQPVPPPTGQVAEPLLPETTQAGSVTARSYFPAQLQIIEDHATRYVRRANVEDAFQTFLSSNNRGYFIVSGSPGIGKSAFVCHLTRTRGLIHHLIKRSGGRADPRAILCSLLYQLATRCDAQVNTEVDLPTLTTRFEALLGMLAKSAGPVTLAIDALDEMPPDAGDDLPFLVTDGLPRGAYFLVTARPGERLERLQERLTDVPWRLYELDPLKDTEVGELLRLQNRNLTERELAWIAEVSCGNPLYLRALTEELASNPTFDLNELPAVVDGYFRQVIRRLPERTVLTKVLQVLAAARTPLTELDLSEITGLDRRQIHDEAVEPVRPFLQETSRSYSFYHERFGEFVRNELVDDVFVTRRPRVDRALAATAGSADARVCVALAGVSFVRVRRLGELSPQD